MPKKKRENGKQTSLRVGNITTHYPTTGLSAVDIKQLFDQLYSKIETRLETPAADKEDLKAELQEIQSTVTEAAKKNEKWMRDFYSVASSTSRAWRLMY